ncbi:MAG TPA: hypothetical protein VFT64_02780 [Rickettsiales bacterium]|nr:hypothetical protein [Rickettsiales bacterium]
MADDKLTKDEEELKKVLLNQDGEIFGLIKVPATLASALNFVLPRIMQGITQKTKPFVTKGTTALASSLLSAPPDQAQRIGELTGRGFEFTFPYLRNISEFIGTGKKGRQQNATLNNWLAPIAQANKASGNSSGLFNNGFSGNKMVASARGIINSSTRRNLMINTTGLSSTLMQNVTAEMGQNIARDQSASPRKGNADKDSVSASSDKLEARIRTHKMLDTYGTLVTGALEQSIKATTAPPDPLKVIDGTSLGMVRKLVDFMRTEGVDCQKIDDHKVGQIADKVKDIFQKFQKEQGRGEIPSHSMKEVADIVAQHLVRGDLSPLSLINIIGKEELLDKTKLEFVSQDKINEVLVKETQILPRSATINVQAFLNTQVYGLGDVANHVKSSDKDERALASIVLPTGVLMKAGMKKADIFKQREQLTSSDMGNIFTVIANSLETLSAADLQKNYGFTADTNKFIVRHAQEGPIDYTQMSPDERNTVKHIIASVTMGLPSAKVQEIIARSKELPPIDSMVAPEQAEEAAPGKSIMEQYGIKGKERPEEWVELDSIKNRPQNNPLARGPAPSHADHVNSRPRGASVALS